MGDRLAAEVQRIAEGLGVWTLSAHKRSGLCIRDAGTRFQICEGGDAFDGWRDFEVVDTLLLCLALSTGLEQHVGACTMCAGGLWEWARWTRSSAPVCEAITETLERDGRTVAWNWVGPGGALLPFEIRASRPCTTCKAPDVECPACDGGGVEREHVPFDDIDDARAAVPGLAADDWNTITRSGAGGAVIDCHRNCKRCGFLGTIPGKPTGLDVRSLARLVCESAEPTGRPRSPRAAKHGRGVCRGCGDAVALTKAGDVRSHTGRGPGNRCTGTGAEPACGDPLARQALAIAADALQSDGITVRPGVRRPQGLTQELCPAHDASTLSAGDLAAHQTPLGEGNHWPCDVYPLGELLALWLGGQACGGCSWTSERFRKVVDPAWCERCQGHGTACAALALTVLNRSHAQPRSHPSDPDHSHGLRGPALVP